MGQVQKRSHLGKQEHRKSPLGKQEHRKSPLGKQEHRKSPLGKQEQRHRTYGISPAEQQELFDSQGGCCAICRITLDQFSNECHLDHDHETGFVRGFLCSRCNKAVAFYEKYKDKALAYMRR